MRLIKFEEQEYRCQSKFIILIDNKRWNFTNNIWFSTEYIMDGEDEKRKKYKWEIDFPEDFPEEYKEEAEKLLNEKLPNKCCNKC